MGIPKIIHQTWKTDDVPKAFRSAVKSVKNCHPGWEYKFWTDESIDVYVRDTFPEFYQTFIGFSRNIMRVDVFRYLIMMDMGGMYCDLDFEFLRPYDYSGSDLILSLERDVNYGDRFNSVSNYFIASSPGHPFWLLIYEELKKNPPVTDSYLEVLGATGPGFLSRHFFSEDNAQIRTDVRLTPRPVFSPYRIRGKNERKLLLNNGMTHGFHLGAGTWKERNTLAYLKTKLLRTLTKRASRPQQTEAAVEKPLM